MAKKWIYKGTLWASGMKTDDVVILHAKVKRKDTGEEKTLKEAYTRRRLGMSREEFNEYIKQRAEYIGPHVEITPLRFRFIDTITLYDIDNKGKNTKSKNVIIRGRLIRKGFIV